MYAVISDRVASQRDRHACASACSGSAARTGSGGDCMDRAPWMSADILGSADPCSCQPPGPGFARRFRQRAWENAQLLSLPSPPAFWWRLRPAARASSLVNSCAWPLWCAARPPRLAISRWRCGSIAANPRTLRRGVEDKELEEDEDCVLGPSLRSGDSWMVMVLPWVPANTWGPKTWQGPCLR